MFLVKKGNFYFFKSSDKPTYGLSTLIKDATKFTSEEATKIVVKHKHWEGIEIVSAT